MQKLLNEIHEKNKRSMKVFTDDLTEMAVQLFWSKVQDKIKKGYCYMPSYVKFSEKKIILILGGSYITVDHIMEQYPVFTVDKFFENMKIL